MKKSIEHELFGFEKVARINSKKKGNTFERKVAKTLGDWVGSEFARVPSSGGLRWKNATDTVGDIVCTDRAFYFPFIIECKHYKDLGLSPQVIKLPTSFEIAGQLIKKGSPIWKFWEQVTADTNRAKGFKLRMVIAKENSHRDFICILDQEILKLLGIVPSIIGVKNEVMLTGISGKELLELNWEKISNILKSYEQIQLDNNTNKK